MTPWDIAFYLLVFVCSYIVFGLIFNSAISYILSFVVLILIYSDETRVNRATTFLKQTFGNMGQKN